MPLEAKRKATMTKQTLIMTTALALLAGAAVAGNWPGPGPGPGPGMAWTQPGPVPFETMDRDRDGRISADEHIAMQQARRAARAAQGYPMRNVANAPRFADIDANADGMVDRDELGRFRAQRMGGPCRRW
jgi:hypothetical protein